MLLAESLMSLGEYKRSQLYFQKCLYLQKQARLLITTMKQKESNDNLEIFIREKYAYCLLKTKEYQEAKAVLSAIPSEFRSVPMNRLLATVSEKSGDSETAKHAYLCIIRSEPYALEAYEGAIRTASVSLTGASSANGPIDPEIVSQLASCIPKNCESWFEQYVKGFIETGRFKLNESIARFKYVESHFPGNPEVWLQIADCYSKHLETQEARKAFAMVRKSDSFIMDRMDRYASLIAEVRNGSLLNKLVDELIHISEDRPESYTAMAIYYHEIKKDAENARRFVDKALIFNPYHAEAILVKAKIHASLNNLKETHILLRRVFRSYKDLRVYCALIESYKQQSRQSEILAVSQELVNYFNGSAKAWAFVGEVLSIYEGDKNRAIQAFMRSLELEPNCLDAVRGLSQLYTAIPRIQDAVEILEAHISKYPCPADLYELLGDLFTKQQKHMNALEHYGIAFAKEPTNEAIKQKLTDCERRASGTRNNGDLLGAFDGYQNQEEDNGMML